MSYTLVHYDESGKGWKLYDTDGSELDSWKSDPRRADHLEMYKLMDTKIKGPKFIRESSDTPINL